MPDDFLRALLGPSGASGTASRPIGAAAELRAWRAAQPPGADTVEQAIVAGAAAASLGWAFAAGYEAAVARLDPEGMRGGVLGALCATEEGGGHPKAIRASLAPDGPDRGGFVLTGRKTWVTLGEEADRLLVVARTGADAGGRPRLRVARIPSGRRGVTLEAGPALPFVPEIGHARAAFESVPVGADELLPGDGYDDALKPFRTVEDIHVTASLLAWATRMARASGWERAWIDEAAFLVLALRALGDRSPSAAETHVALAGALGSSRRLLERGEWSKCEEATRAGWERDRRIFDVAAAVRGARLEAAWKVLGQL